MNADTKRVCMQYDCDNVNRREIIQRLHGDVEFCAERFGETSINLSSTFKTNEGDVIVYLLNVSKCTLQDCCIAVDDALEKYQSTSRAANSSPVSQLFDEISEEQFNDISRKLFL